MALTRQTSLTTQQRQARQCPSSMLRRMSRSVTGCKSRSYLLPSANSGPFSSDAPRPILTAYTHPNGMGVRQALQTNRAVKTTKARVKRGL